MLVFTTAAGKLYCSFVS